MADAPFDTDIPITDRDHFARLAAFFDADGNLVNPPEPPDDFEDEDAFMEFVRKAYSDATEADQTNREEAREDLKFIMGEQWPSDLKRDREADQLPALVLNRLPAFVGQVLGNRLLNETGIRVLPERDATQEEARLRQGLIRGIEKVSRAEIAYNNAFLYQVACGEGAWKVELDYADDDVFEQDIRISRIADPMSIAWDPMSTDPTGADARYVFVSDMLDEEEFKERYPNAKVDSFKTDSEIGGVLRGDGWYDQGNVRVSEFWRMRAEPRRLAMMQDGDTVDVTDLELEDWLPLVASDPQTGAPMVRDSFRRYAEMYLVSGSEILEGPYSLPIHRVPVFRAIGWEVRVDDAKHRWGMIRFLKDSQRMHNYWRSVIVEKLMQAPANTWLAGKSAVEGLQDKFRAAAKSRDPLLIYNDESGAKPERIAPAPMEAALIEQAGMAAQDIKDITNIHEANLGVQSNEVSGKAILARQRVGETGMAIYQENMNAAIEECGRVVNALLPYVYNTARVVSVVGQDDVQEMRQINLGDGTPNITSGKYNISIITGPSYATKRVEAAESMLNMVNAMPDTMAVAADKIVEAQDWPGAEEIARRLRQKLGYQDPEEDLTPEQLQQLQQERQMAQRARELELAEKEAEVAMKQNQAADFAARTADAQARAMKTLSDMGLKATELQAKIENQEFEALIDLLKTANEITQSQGDELNG